MLHSEKDLDKPYPEVYGLVHSMACLSLQRVLFNRNSVKTLEIVDK